jgi:4-hydroxy-tetrahydrodipicolinate reductase
MGVAIRDAAGRLGYNVAGAVDVGDDPQPFVGASDVFVDFSHHTATANVIALAASAGKALVIGTTGHPADERAKLAATAAKVPCVWAGNFSVGVNLLNHLAGEAARALGSEYEIELIEMHHRMKKDAPSGTAEALLRIVEEARGLSAADEKHGRSGITGERPARQIGVHALRGGGDGDAFEIITAAGGISGTFADTILPALGGNLSWNLDYSANSVTITVVAPILPGDYNDDGMVNAADYVVWRDHFGSATSLPNDSTPGVDAGDYGVWQANFGAPPGIESAENVAVSEPSSLLLTILAASLLSQRGRRQIFHSHRLPG